MKVHTGDSVLIISGKDKGKQGTVMRVLETKNRLIIEGINMRTRHIKKTAQAAGQRIKYEASISASNVMLLDPKTKKPTRVGYRRDEKTGKKVRFAKVSGEVLPIVSTVKAVEKKTKKTTKTKSATKEEAKTTESSSSSTSSPSSSSSPPTKQPFWKRAFSAGPATEEGNAPTGNDAGGPSTVAPVRRSRESNG